MNKKIYDCLVAYIIENQNKFYRLAYSYVRNQEDALDAVQNAVCKALEKSCTLRNENAMKTWFYSILVNECLSILNAKKQTMLTNTDTAVEPSYEEKGFELQDEMHEKINQLDEPERSIIRLRFFEELSLSEIAEVLQMNLSTVKSKLYRSLEKMKVVVTEGDIV